MNTDQALAGVEDVSRRIRFIRGQRVIMDSDLAELYGVETRVLNQAVKRNAARFPEDFVFQLAENEEESLRSQIVILKKRRGEHRKFPPYAFTEHGAIMAANVLNSERAVTASVFVVRAFVKLREFLATHKELAQKLAELEQRLSTHDKAIRSLFDAIRQLMVQPEPKKRTIGFLVGDKKE